MSKPYVWIVEVKAPRERGWYPRYDSGCYRTKASAEEVARYQSGGAMMGLLQYRVAKYVRIDGR